MAGQNKPTQKRQQPAKGPASPQGGNSKAPPPASPPGRKSAKAVKRKTKLPAGWCISCRNVLGFMRIITMTLSSMEDDAYSYNLTKLLESGPDAETEERVPVSLNETEAVAAMLELGLWGTANMRVSLTNPSPLTNSKNTFTRKAFIQIIDPEEATEENALETCKAFKRYFELQTNNKFGTQVFIKQPGWCLDVPGAPLPKIDNYIVYDDIVSIIKDMFEGVDRNWGANNMEAASTYFTKGHAPYEAHCDLGFPTDYCQDPGPAVMPGIRN